MSFEEAFQAADLAVRSIRADGLRDIERVVLEGSWHRLTYQKIASQAGYTEGYLSRDIGPALWKLLSDALGTQVKKTNFRTAIEHWSKTHPIRHDSEPTLSPLRQGESAVLFQTLPEAVMPPIDVEDFRGREAELADIADWVINERGRLLCLYGPPGIGKTWLAIKLAATLETQMAGVIYRPVHDRPSPLTLVTELLQYCQISVPESVSLSQALDWLVNALTQRRLLIIVDGTDVFYRAEAFAGTYATDRADYSQVLSTLATHDHQSCVLWVGRERPRSAVQITGSSCRLHRS